MKERHTLLPGALSAYAFVMILVVLVASGVLLTAYRSMLVPFYAQRISGVLEVPEQYLVCGATKVVVPSLSCTISLWGSHE